MKKATFSAVISTAIVCYLFWLLVTGQIVSVFKGEASLQIWVAGAIVSLGVALFSAKFFIHKKPFYLLNPVRLVKLIVYCLPVFLWELTKANVDMAIRAFTMNIKPGIVKVPVNLKSEYGQAMLADSITLTPGTITMDIVEEKDQVYYYIHWINVESTDHKTAGDAIKGTLEKWVGRIWA